MRRRELLRYGAEPSRGDLLDEVRHAHLLRGRLRCAQQLLRTRAVTRAVAAPQQLGELVLDARDDRPGLPAHGQSQRGVEMAFGVLVAAHGARQHTEIAGHRPDAHRAAGHRDVAVRIGQEQRVQRRCPRCVAQRRGHLGEQRHPDDPGWILRDTGEVALGERVEQGAGFLLLAGFDMERGEGDSPGRHVRVLGGERLQGKAQFLETPLRAPQEEELPGVGLLGVRVVRALTLRERLAGQPLRVGEAAVLQRTHGAEHRREPCVHRLAHGLGQPRVAGDLGLDRPHVAELEQVGDPPADHLDGALTIAGFLGEPYDLARERQALVRVAHPGAGDLARVERVCPCRGVAHALRHRKRPLAELRDAPGILRVGELRCQACHDPHLQGAVGGREPAHRLFQQPAQQFVGGPHLEVATPRARSPRARGFRLRRARAPSGGLDERLAGGRNIAGAAQRLAERQPQRRAPVRVRVANAIETSERHAVEACAGFVGEHGDRLLCGAARVLHALVDAGDVDTAHRGGREPVLGELGEPILGDAPALQCARDSPVQLGLLRPVHLLVDGVANERVREPIAARHVRDLGQDSSGDGLADARDDRLLDGAASPIAAAAVSTSMDSARRAVAATLKTSRQPSREAPGAGG